MIDIDKVLAECRAQAPEALVLLRIGDFFEAFGDDAEAASRVCGLALTTRGNGRKMCGFPHHYRDDYVARLVAAGRRVALCDLVPDTEPIDRRHAKVEVPA